MKPAKFILVLTGLAMFFNQSIQGQISINEFTASNYNHFDQEDYGYVDWMEIKNNSNETMDISGYWLSDDELEPLKYQIPAGTNIMPGELHLVYLERDPMNYNQSYTPHSNFNITQTKGESIVLSDNSGILIESVSFENLGTLQKNHSYVKITGENDEWHITDSPSPGQDEIGDIYSGYNEMPTSNQVAGHYSGNIEVSIGSNNGGSIHYTTDGSIPTLSSELYAGPINISQTSVLRSRVFSMSQDLLPSKVLTQTFFIGEDSHTIPVVSISGSTLSDGAWGIMGQDPENELTHIEFFDENGQFETSAFGDSNKHGHDVNAYDQRGFDFVCRDKLGYNRTIEHELFENSTARDSYQHLIFKCSGQDNYPFGNGGNGAMMRDVYNHLYAEHCNMELDVRTGEYCILYINGEYWGLYDMREKVDDRDYFDKYYDQGTDQVDYYKTWGGVWTELLAEGSWDEINNYVSENDLSQTESYEYIASQVNMNSLADFFIWNSTMVNSSWLNWDHAWWKGYDEESGELKWKHTLWDTDHSWGNGINFTGIINQGADAGHFDYLELSENPGGQGHLPMITELLNNSEFENFYNQRRSEWSEGCLNCNEMLAFVDSLRAVIEPEMERQCERWGGTTDEWNENVDFFRNFISQRCEEVTSLNEILNPSQTLVVSPNPSEGNFKIYHSEPGIVQVFDNLGKLVAKEMYQGGIQDLNSNHLNSGIYIIHINGHSERLVIEK